MYDVVQIARMIVIIMIIILLGTVLNTLSLNLSSLLSYSMTVYVYVRAHNGALQITIHDTRVSLLSAMPTCIQCYASSSTTAQNAGRFMLQFQS